MSGVLSREMPHSKPCATSFTSSLMRRSERDLALPLHAPSRTEPGVGVALHDALGDHAARHDAGLGDVEHLRTSALPSGFSMKVGLSCPSISAFMSSTAS
jgi:hypothetical protein